MTSPKSGDDRPNDATANEQAPQHPGGHREASNNDKGSVSHRGDDVQASQLDLDAAAAHLAWHRPGGPWVLTAISNDRLKVITRTFAADQHDDLCAWIAEHNGAKRNVYFMVNPATRKLVKKADTGDVASLDFLHVDIDPMPGRDIDDERNRILAALHDCHGLPKPSAIVFSGGGYQAFWRLDKPVAINGDREKCEDLKHYNLQIELMLGADSCHNVDRIMRLAGTVNWPSDKKLAKGQVPAVAQVLEAHDFAYPLSKFTKAPALPSASSDAEPGKATAVNVAQGTRRHVNLDELPKELNPRCKVIITKGQDDEQPLQGADQSRSAWLLHAVGSLLRAGVSDEDVYSIITDPDYKVSASVLDKGSSAQVHRYACRQIARAKEEVIAPELLAMNDKHVVIKSFEGKCRVLLWEDGKPVFQSFADFRNAWCNRTVFVDAGKDANGNPKLKAVPLGDWWLRHPERREYGRVEFDPSREVGKGDASVLNLWDGFAVEPKPGDCSLIRAHLREVICASDGRLHEYLLKWLAWKVQNPGARPQVALVLLGLQGTGKGTLWDILARIFGRHALHISRMEQVTGRFNKHLMDKCLVFADEAFADASKADIGNFKRLITDETVFIEPKGIDADGWPNRVGYIIASNLEHAVHLDHDDRRTVVFDVPAVHKEDESWFGPLREQIDNGGCEAFLHHLLSIDLGRWHPRQDRPNTAAKDRLKGESLPGFEAVWYELLQEGAICYHEKDGKRWVPTDWLIEQAKRRGHEVKYNHVRNLLVGPQANHRGKPGMGFEQVRDDRYRGYMLPAEGVDGGSSLAQARLAWDRTRFRGDWPEGGGAEEWAPIKWEPRAF